MNELGYGFINAGGHYGKAVRAHRVSWIIHNGPIPKGLFVCHVCDNPSCVRPDHLFLGTCGDNNRDMQRKGRYDRVKRPKGERHGMSILTEGTVRLIREARQRGQTLKSISEGAGISIAHVHRICTGKNWKHVNCSRR